MLQTAAVASVLSTAATTVTWASFPVRPNDTVLLQGSNLGSVETVRVSAGGYGWWERVSPVHGQSSAGSLKFVLPASLPERAVYAVEMEGADKVRLNEAEPWWTQGDLGNAASPGGWIRVFGRAMAYGGPPDRLAAAVRQQSGGAEVRDGPLNKAAHAHLRLRSETFDDVVLMSAWASDWTAHFHLPRDLPTGVYEVAVRNDYDGAAFVPLMSFVSPERPRVSDIAIRQPLRPAAKRFTVPRPPPGRRAPTCAGTFPSAAGSGKRAYDSSSDVQSAIDAAERAGGGTVYLPRGQYWLSKALGIPPGVVLAGEGTSLVSLYFKEADASTAPQPALIYASELSAGSPPVSSPVWGVENLTVYVTHFYRGAVRMGEQSSFSFMRRVRIRANAYFAENTLCGAEAPMGVTRGRYANYSWQQIGPLVLADAENFEVTDCDLFATGIVIDSTLKTPARYGFVARNRIWNGNAAHWFDNARQVIFEQNHVTGTTFLAMGNNVDSYGGGYSQHLYFGRNVYESVWGNDREVVTYDNAGGCYFGPVSSVSEYGDEVVTVGSAISEECGGGAVVVLNGTGAGQYRRIVAAEKAGGGVRYALDRPFDVLPGNGSYVQALPFRGRNILTENVYRDVGAVQFYGIGIDNVVSDCVGERMTGWVAWGQWRGYEHGTRWDVPGGALGGGNYGANMNLHNQIMYNLVTEGNNVVNYDADWNDKSGGYACFLNGSTFAVTDVTLWLPDGSKSVRFPHGSPRVAFPVNSFIVIRGNTAWSNGGVTVDHLAEDVLVEANTFAYSDAGISVDPTCKRVLSRGNRVSADDL